jgi:phospholipid transport system substrate-binding protein
MQPATASHRLAASFLASMILLAVPRAVPAEPPPPLAVVQSCAEPTLRIIKSSLSGEGPGLRQRRDEILRIVDGCFDFTEMSKRALARSWKNQPAGKQQEFVRLFKQLLFSTYARRIEDAAAASTNIAYDRTMIDGDYSMVKTRAVSDKAAPVEIEYKLRLQPDGWKVYDVVVEGISLIDNYREQFSSILSSRSFDSLLSSLREKVEAQSNP